MKWGLQVSSTIFLKYHTVKNKTGWDSASVSQLPGPRGKINSPLKCLSLAPSLTQNTGFVYRCQLWHNARFIFIKRVNHNVLFCFQFSVLLCCLSRADSFKISSRRRETPPTPPRWTVTLFIWLLGQCVNTSIRFLSQASLMLLTYTPMHNHINVIHSKYTRIKTPAAVVAVVVVVVCICTWTKKYEYWQICCYQTCWVNVNQLVLYIPYIDVK